MLICPHDGHALEPEQSDGEYCAQHGVPFFSHCPTCNAPWPLDAKHNVWGDPDSGASFCERCATPAPWLTREQLLQWIEAQVRAEGMRGTLPRNDALELAALIKRLEPMSGDDTRSVEVWKRLRQAVPTVWAKVEPVAQSVIGEVVKRALGL